MGDEVVELSGAFRLMAWKGAFKRHSHDPLRAGKSLHFDSYRPLYMPGKHEDFLEPLRDRFVYALPVLVDDQHNPFGMDGHAAAPEVLGFELFFDAAGNMSLNSQLHPSAATFGGRPPLKPVAPSAETGPRGDQLHLPISIASGKLKFRLHWCFVASPARLTDAAIKILEDRTAFQTIPVRLKRLILTPSLGAREAGESLLQHSTQGEVAGVLDLSTVGPGLNQGFLIARGDLVGYTTPFKGQDPQKRKDALDRSKKKLLAELLKSCLDGGDKAQLRDHLASDGKSVENFLEEYRTGLRSAVEWAEQRAAEVCTWLDGPLFLQVLAPSFLAEKRMADWLDVFALSCEQLFDSVAGKALLAKHLKDPKHPVHEFVMPPARSPEDAFKVIQKSAPAVLALWGEYAKVHLALKKPIAEAAKGLNNATHLTLLETVTLPSGFQTIATGKGYKTIQFEATLLKEAEPAVWAKLVSAPAAEGVISRFVAGLEVINLFLSLQAIQKADGALATGKEVLATIGSLCTTFSAIGAVRKLEERTLKFASGVGAVIDVFIAVYDMNEMGKRNDYSAMGGAFIIGIGSALVAAGCFCAAGGVAAAPTIIGLPLAAALEVVGGILVAIGTVIVVFTTDSDAQLLASHCVFGEKHGDGDTSFTWAGGRLRDWKGDFDKQISALFNLLAGFTLESVDHRTVRVLYGFTKPQSMMKLEFALTFNGGTRLDPRLDVRFEDKKVTQTGGRKAKVTPKFTTIEGRAAVELRVEFPDGEKVFPPPAQTHLATFNAQLLLDGATAPIPGSGKKVEHKFFEFGSALGKGVVAGQTHSKDS